MSYISFISGLEGDRSLAERTTEIMPGTYAHAASLAAQDVKLPFYRTHFQTAAKPNPTLSEMGRTVAQEIALMNHAHGKAGVIVASSVGAGVALQAFLNLKDIGAKLPALLLFKPAIDPLSLITDRLRDHGALAHLDMLKAGKIPYLPIPVDPSPQSPNPGTFLLTPAHVNDSNALRLLTTEKSRNFFAYMFSENKIPEIMLQTAMDDPMCTAMVAGTFARVAETATDHYSLDLLPGRRSDDHGADLRAQIKNMAIRQALRPI